MNLFFNISRKHVKKESLFLEEDKFLNFSVIFFKSGVFRNCQQYLNIRKMGKRVQKSIKKEQEYHDNESQNKYSHQSEFEEKYSNNDDDVFFSANTPHSQKQKKSKREKNIRIFKPEDRFLPQHIRRYYLFPFHYSTLFPFFKISWKNWKPNGIYKKMAEFLSNLGDNIPNKTPSQCKSYDQRMKYIHYEASCESDHFDLLEAALRNLQREKLDETSLSFIANYVKKMEEKSSYIDFLEKDMGCFDEESSANKNGDGISVEQKKEDATLISAANNEDEIFNDFFREQPNASVL